MKLSNYKCIVTKGKKEEVTEKEDEVPQFIEKKIESA